MPRRILFSWHFNVNNVKKLQNQKVGPTIHASFIQIVAGMNTHTVTQLSYGGTSAYGKNHASGVQLTYKI